MSSEIKILVINSGSSSVKTSLFVMPQKECLVSCMVERIGEAEQRLLWDGSGASWRKVCDAPDHDQAVDIILRALVGDGQGVLRSLDEIRAVGHRVVHGGEKIIGSRAVDDELIEIVKENSPLAPLHNPANLCTLQAAMERLPGKMHVAVFDTAFHESLPPRAYLYAIPHELYTEHHVRRYGFHGISLRYVTQRAAEMLSRPLESCNLIALHLGNGCSATAISGGRSVDTSMGFTPLEGLVMGTRSGDIDPALVFFFVEMLGMSPEEVDKMLNHESGLAGLSGVGNDLREVHKAADQGNERARVALDVYAYRIKKYVGAYHAVLGRTDALIFTAGVGENGARLRQAVCEGLEPLGFRLDPEKNRQTAGTEAVISAHDSGIAIFVIPTNEELMIAMDTHDIYRKRKGGE